MNMIAPGMNVLATVESLSALDVFEGDDAHEKLVVRLEEYVRAQPQDMATEKGRDAIRSLAAKVSRTKTGLDDLGKDFVAALKKQTGAVDAKRKLIRDRLDVLRDEVRNPLTVFEEAEANRVNEHERLLVSLAGVAVFTAVPTVAEIDDRLAKLEPFTTRFWEEFSDRAIEGIDEATNKLNGFRAATVKQEADAAELVALRKQVAENEAARVAAKVEADKAENARIAAEQEAARTAEREQARLQREADLAIQAKQDAETAAARAVETERRRVAKVEADAAAAAAKREANVRHRKKVLREIVDAMVASGIDAAAATILAVEIDQGKIPHVSITY
jgi:colicin import membrane protein